MPPPTLSRRARTALQAAITERGGPLPALGFAPAPTLPAIPRGGGGSNQLDALLALLKPTTTPNPFGAFSATKLPGINEIPGISYIGIAGALAATLASLLGGSLFSGRPKDQATIEIGARLAEAPSPVLKKLGAQIIAAGQQGKVLSSKADLLSTFEPLILAAIQALIAEGIPPSSAQGFVMQGVFNPGAPLPTPPTLPRPLVPPSPAFPFPGEPGAPPPTVFYNAPTQVPVGAATVSAQGGPRGTGLKQNYRIILAPPEFGAPPSAAQAIVPPLAAAAAVAPSSLPMVPASVLPTWLQPLLRFAGVEQSMSGVLKLLRGGNLTAEEFGSLAGLAVGTFAGNPVAGAAVGLEVGAAVGQLDHIAQDYFGSSLDRLIGQFGLSSYQLARALVGQGGGNIPLTPPLAPQPPTPPAIPPPPPPPLAPQPRQPELLPPPPPREPLPPLAPQPFQPALQPIPPQAPQPPCPSGNCPEPEPCPPEVRELVKQLTDCPPEVLQPLLQRIQVHQEPGKKPSLQIKQPICLCCESTDDLNQYVGSNGALGQCVQVQGAEASMLGFK